MVFAIDMPRPQPRADRRVSRTRDGITKIRATSAMRFRHASEINKESLS
jgi:hypothetical protein